MIGKHVGRLHENASIFMNFTKGALDIIQRKVI
jgi:hypothetical protein